MSARPAPLAALATLALVLAATPAHGARAAKSAARTATAAVTLAAPARDPWHTARALADAAEYDSALAVLRHALARAGDDVGLRWLEAGITGEAGRHAEAVRLYEKLSADHPERADEWRGDLAGQRLAAGDAAGAVRDFRRRLAGSPDDEDARRGLPRALAEADSLAAALAAYDSLLAATPGDTDLELGRARVLGWMGRHGAAVAAYRAVLAREPANADARLGVAMNENWEGRHRRATRELEALSRAPGADPEALKQLAFARYWDDDPDGAQAALDAYAGRVPDDREARELAETIAREQRARLELTGGRADDSDALRVRSTGMELTFPLARGAGGLLAWHRDNVLDSGGTVDPLRLSAGLRARLDPVWSAYGTYTHTDWGDGPGVRPGGEAGLVCRPLDRVRLEGVLSREPVVTRRSLALGITLLDWAGAVDLSPTEVLGLHAVAREGIYSDGNRAERVLASARLRVVSSKRGEAALTLATESLNSHEDLDDGYYAPDFHRETGPGAEVEWRPHEGWTLGGNVQMGYQQDKGEDGTSFYVVGGRIETAFARLVTVALEGGRSNSSLQSENGYRRAWWQASIARGF